jgi:hypothetical protein
MKKLVHFMVVSFTLILSGCVFTTAPLFDQSNAINEPEISGFWQKIESEGQDLIRFVSDSEHSYIASENFDLPETDYQVKTLQLGEYKLMERLTQAGDYQQIRFRIWKNPAGTFMALSKIDYEWFESSEHQLNIEEVEEKDYVKFVIHDDADELRDFLSNPNINVWDEEQVYLKVE